MRVKIGGEVMTMKIAFVIIAIFILSLGLFANESDTLMNALKNDDINKAKELIMSGVNINTRNIIGETPLMEAAEKGYTEIVELLLNKRVNINISNVKNITALSKAAYNGHTDYNCDYSSYSRYKAQRRHKLDIAKAHSLFS